MQIKEADEFLETLDYTPIGARILLIGKILKYLEVIIKGKPLPAPRDAKDVEFVTRLSDEKKKRVYELFEAYRENDIEKVEEIKRTFEGTVRQNGIEVDGRVFSPSLAAVYCIQKAGSPRKTANGWTMWKTEDGVLLDTLYRKLKERFTYSE